MSFIIICNNNEKIEVNINNENVQKSKFLIASYEEYEEGDEIFIPFSSKMVENYINGDINFNIIDIKFNDIKFETVYNFLNYLIVDDEVMINYLSYKLYKIDFEEAKQYIENIIDKSFLKILEQKEDIVECVGNNDIVGVFIWIKSGADVNAKNKNGITALHYASIKGHNEIVELLLESGADINIKDEFGKTALHKASQEGHIKVVFLLLEYGADVNAKDKYGCTALHNVSYNGHIEIVKLLLESGADSNVKDKWDGTALHNASTRGCTEIAKVLLEYGADINAKDEDGCTALHIASEEGYIKVVKLLLKSGADVNTKNDDDKTALHYASRYGHTDIVKLLK